MKKIDAFRAALAAELKKDIYGVVKENAPISVAEVAKKTSVHWYTAKKYLDELEKEGLVNCTRTGRIWVYTLTGKEKAKKKAKGKAKGKAKVWTLRLPNNVHTGRDEHKRR